MIVLPRVVFVTGTDTDVGKTIATAALAAALSAHGRHVAVYKPTQAGTDDDDNGDIDIIRRLTGLTDLTEGIRLPEPMAPVAAAARAGVALPTARQHSATIEALASTHDHTLIEGAGGLLVHLDEHGHTLADLATATTSPAAAVLVCRSGLGTLNHTELTLEALTRRHIPTAGTIIGSWPRHPTAIEHSNHHYLNALPTPLIGVIPERATQLDTATFTNQAQHWLAARPEQTA